MGRAVAARLAVDHTVVAVDLDADALVWSDGITLAADATDEEAMREAATLAERHAPLVGWVNNAAIFGGMKLDFLITVPWDYYEKFMSVNLNGALLMVRACWEKMAAAGGGAIVNQSSTAAWLYSGFYGLAKVGVNGLTQQLATELGGSNIRVNAIQPGLIATEMTQAMPEHIWDAKLAEIPMERAGTPEEIASMCAWLASDDAGFATGADFSLNGGMHMG